MNMSADFNFWMPFEISKAKSKDGKEKMRIKGIASTPDLDTEEEILEPQGFDLSRFLEIGYINWNHQAKNDAGKIIGEPDVARITPNGDLYVEGNLYNDHPLAKSVWEFAKTLEANGSKRRLGFSIEGKALERSIANPKRITRALITGLAVTPNPVNGSTYLDIVKGTQKEDYVNYKFDDESSLEESKKDNFLYEFNVGKKSFGITKSFDCIEIEKGGKKAQVGEVRTLSDGSQHQKQGDGSWKKIKDGNASFNNSKPKKSFISFIPYKRLQELPESLKKKSKEELESLLQNKEKHYNSGVTSYNDKQRIKTEIWDIKELIAAHKKAEEPDTEKAMDTVSTAPLIPESMSKKIKVLENKAIIRKAIDAGVLPIEKLIRN
jgi:hypothetical protein